MNTVTETPGELMRQVAMTIGDKYKDVTVTVPKNSTWWHVLQAVEAALGSKDDTMTVIKSRSEDQKARFRQIALDNVASWDTAGSTVDGETFSGLPIRTYYEADSIPLPKRVVSKRLKENMIPFEDMKLPYHLFLAPAIGEVGAEKEGQDQRGAGEKEGRQGDD